MDEACDLAFLLRTIHYHQRHDPAALANVNAAFRPLVGSVLRFTARDIERPARVLRARQLLEAGNDVATARNVLARQFNCSTRTAYRLLQDALNMGPR